MNLNINYLSSNTLFYFKESILPSFTAQQKKIIVIASIAFALLAAWYVASRCCFKSKKEDEFKDEKPPSPEVCKLEEVDKRPSRKIEKLPSPKIDKLPLPKNDKLPAPAFDKLPLPKKDSRPIAQPTQTEEETERLTYLSDRSVLSEKDQNKIDEMLHWVLTHADQSTPTTKELMKQFITDTVEKSRSQEIMESDGAYIRRIETLSPENLRIYVQLLDFQGSRLPPLFYHLQKEHQSVPNGGDSNKKLVGERLKIIFPTFTPAHAEVLTAVNDFWNLLYVFPIEAAASLKPEVLAILAKNKKRHSLELKKLVPAIPEDHQLFEKLNAIAPHASDPLEMALQLKAERLIHSNYTLHGSPATPEQKKALKQQSHHNIKAGLENHRLEKEKEAAEALKTPVKPSPKKWVPKTPAKDDSPKIEIETAPIIPKPQWRDDQCVSYLKEKPYTQNEDKDAEEIVFDWILNREHLFDDESFRPELIAFIEFTVSNPLYIETTRVRLERMSKAQHRYFVKLLGTERIETLWTLEATCLFALSSETNKISRLKTALNSLSDVQWNASIGCEKFFEVLRIYPKFMGSALTTAQWGAIAARIDKEKVVLSTLAQLVYKMDTDEDKEFPHKLHAITGLVKKPSGADEHTELRKALRHEIEKKLILCPADIRKVISALLK